MKDLSIESDFDSGKNRNPLQIDPNEYNEFYYSGHSPHQKIASLISFINKNLYDVSQLSEEGSKFLLPEAFTTALEKMRSLILMLMIQDHSRNICYAKELSQTWHQIVEYFTPFAINKTDSTGIKSFVEKFIADIKAYPEKADHPLGYYLQKYAGENWLPVPFISILKNLHNEHVKNGDKSRLNAWFLQLSQLIDYSTSKKK